MDRPHYLEQALASWAGVRGLNRWHVVFRVEPGQVTPFVVDQIKEFVVSTGLTDYEIIVNPTRLGVLHHPWVGFEHLFVNYDFVVRAEDDLLVSEDILEFFEWASVTYLGHPGVTTVVAYTDEEGLDYGVRKACWFSPLVWGVWRQTWADVLRDTWDHDYSTNNGVPGVNSGWDWQIARIYTSAGLTSVFPTSSRVDNIGVHGVHSTIETYARSPSFVMSRPQGAYTEQGGPYPVGWFVQANLTAS